MRGQPRSMYRRSEYDVQNRVNTTDPEAVAGEVCRIFQDLYQTADAANIGEAFADLTSLYRGQHPAYYACDTSYHDLQHVLDVTLAMARLMDGAVRAHHADTLTERLFRFGIVAALFHDCGYIRHRKDTRHMNGAEYTKVHVSRGGRFLEEYLPALGMADLAPVAARTLHFTGYEIPIEKIRVEPEIRLVGNLLGSADILAQMADRCYLEKCYDRLYPEFVLGGIARQAPPEGKEQVVFGSAADLIFQTPRFYEAAHKRLREELGACCDYGEKHFGGENLYFSELGKNIRHASHVADAKDISMLRRQPPEPAIAAVEPERLI
jgi:hypothetical protein